MASDLALIVGIGIVAYLLVAISQTLSDEHIILKWIMNFTAILSLLFIPGSLVELTTYKTSSKFYLAYIWFVRIFCTYLFMYYLVYTPMMKWGWIGKK